MQQLENKFFVGNAVMQQLENKFDVGNVRQPVYPAGKTNNFGM
jgi:hypothetical protein